MTSLPAATTTAAIQLRGVRHRFGDVVALADVDLHDRPSRATRDRRAERVREIHPPLRDRRPPSSRRRGPLAIEEAVTAARSPSPLRPDAAARPLAPLADRASTTPPSHSRTAASSAAGPCEIHHVRSSNDSGSPSSRSGRRRSSPVGCASASRSCGRSWPRRTSSLLDEPFAALDSITRSGMQEWLLSALEQEPRTAAARDARRRRGAPAHAPGHRDVGAPRADRHHARDGPPQGTAPGARSPRLPEFASLKESALEALEL